MTYLFFKKNILLFLVVSKNSFLNFEVFENSFNSYMLWITRYYPKLSIRHKRWAANIYQPQHWVLSQLKKSSPNRSFYISFTSFSKTSKKFKSLVHYNSYYNFLYFKIPKSLLFSLLLLEKPALSHPTGCVPPQHTPKFSQLSS